jgi:hypothetical protein
MSHNLAISASGCGCQGRKYCTFDLYQTPTDITSGLLSLVATHAIARAYADWALGDLIARHGQEKAQLTRQGRGWNRRDCEPPHRQSERDDLQNHLDRLAEFLMVHPTAKFSST